MHPALRLVFFFSMLFTGMGIALFSAAVSYGAWTGVGFTELLDAMNSPGPDDRLFLFWMNDLNQLVAFGGASLAFFALFGRHGVRSKSASRPGIKWWVLAAVGTLSAGPLIDLAYRLNRWAVEQTAWNNFFGGLEKSAAEMTELLLVTDGAGDIALLLLSIAVLPAVCEELAFRGVLQPLIARWSGNVHVGIWVSAVLFSAIHLQFYGFGARVLLGAGLGYLVVHSGRLWLGMVAHGINNAAVVVAVLVWPEWMGEEALIGEMVASDWATLAAGTAVLATVIFFVRRESRWERWREDYVRPA